MKTRRAVLAGVVLLVFGGAYVGRRLLVASGPAADGNGPAAAGGYRRLVSLAPSITETLFALDLGERVVGVTRYCTYPPEARTRAKIGGFTDTNYEAVLRLQPDLVVLLPSHREAKRRLDALGLKTFVTGGTDVPGILASIRRLGEACGVKERGSALADELGRSLARVQRRTQGRPRPRVLVCVSRQAGSGAIGEIWASGPDGFLGSLVPLAGGENVLDAGAAANPQLSAEGIVRLDPQVIIDVSGVGESGLAREKLLADWQALAGVRAVRDGRVHVFDADYATIPGPRFVRVLKDLARALHPEVRWE